ncbi:MAG: phytoene desaturase family protein, partial [Solirubrobacterales bacterium]
MSDADVIVVGAGHNGLACAAYLARAGLDVLALEERDEVGGTAATVDALGARVNICNCEHTLFRATPIPDELELAEHGLRYIDVDPAMLNMGWDGSPAWMVFHDLERTVESVALARGDRQARAYRRYAAAAVPLARLVLEVANQPPSLASIASSLRRRRARGLLPALAWARRSSAGVLRSLFDDEAMIAPCVAAGPATWGLSPHARGGGYGALMYAIKHVVRAGRPEGGSGALPRALEASLRARGGRVRCAAAVTRLLIDRARVTGVELAGGERLRADTVVAACDPRLVVLSWLREPPPVARRLVARWRSRPGIDGYQSKLDAVVRTMPRYRSVRRDHLDRLGVADECVPTAIVAPPVDQIAAAHVLARQGAIADRLMHYVNLPTLLDPTMAPSDLEGAHVLSLECIYTPYALEGGWRETTEPERWLRSFAGLLEPGFLEGVVRQRVVTPPIYESEFGCPRGCPPAFQGTPLHALVGFQRELTRYETPVDGLFLTGAGTFPGPGVWGATGRNAAAVVVARRERSAP